MPFGCWLFFFFSDIVVVVAAVCSFTISCREGGKVTKDHSELKYHVHES